MVDTDTMMNEMGGAFMVAWLAGGMNSIEGALVLAAAWMAISGAHILPVITWGHIMTGDLSDSGAWQDNGSRLAAQVVGALLAVVLMTEAGAVGPDYDAAATATWAFDLWPAMGTMAAGALLWTVYDRCDAWVAAFVVLAMSGTLALGGASDMGAMIMGDLGGDLVDVASNWVMDGALAGVGALISVKVADM
jgi:glycerol uptake facilitator-like aquaporin